MGTLEEKLNYLNETKNLIRQALIAKGVEVPENTPFREYAEKINTIVVSTDQTNPSNPENPIGNV